MLKSKGGFKKAIYDAVSSLYDRPSISLDIRTVNSTLSPADTLTEGYINNPREYKPAFVVYDFPLGLKQANADFIFYITEVDNQKIYYKYKYTGEDTPDISVNFHLIY